MTNRIPPSLNWLVKKRAETHGELLRIEDESKHYIKWYKWKLEKLQDDLISIDRTITLHEIRISPDIIPPKQSRPVGSKLKHGQLTQFILEALYNFDDNCATISQLSNYVTNKGKLLKCKNITTQALNNSVRYRVKNLCNQGVIERMPKGYKGSHRSYRLKI